MNITAQRIAIFSLILVVVIALISLVYRISPVKTLDYQGFLKGISNGGLHLDLQGGGK